MHGSESTTPDLVVRTEFPSHARDWDDFVNAFANQGRYHSSAWLETIRRAYRLRIHNVVARNNGGLLGVLPLFEQPGPSLGRYLTSIPFLNDGGVVAESAAIADLLATEATRLCGRIGARHAELRHAWQTTAATRRRGDKIRAVLDLPTDPAVLWKRIPSKVRSQVRRPTKAGLTARTVGAEGVTPFYEIVSEKWRALGSPFHSRSFFHELLSRTRSDTDIILIEGPHGAVAAGWLYTTQGVTEILWAAARRDFDHQSPNMLLYWHAFTVAIARGSREFDFGRSTRGSGTHRFKRQWGSRIEPLPWEYVGVSPLSVPDPTTESVPARLFRSVWPKLPLSVTRSLGPVLARRLPL
jgi:FemAB-related protein (PEP-CTERM system-associated)